MTFLALVDLQSGQPPLMTPIADRIDPNQAGILKRLSNGAQSHEISAMRVHFESETRSDTPVAGGEPGLVLSRLRQVVKATIEITFTIDGPEHLAKRPPVGAQVQPE